MASRACRLQLPADRPWLFSATFVQGVTDPAPVWAPLQTAPTSVFRATQNCSDTNAWHGTGHCCSGDRNSAFDTEELHVSDVQ